MKDFSNSFGLLSSFSQNIEFCRESIFDLRYADVTNYIGLSESSMISYDTKGVAPYISVADVIAKLYCTSIDRLCGTEIIFDKEEVLSLQVNFINRVGGIPVRLYKEKLLKDISKHSSLYRADVYSMISSCFKVIIKDLCKLDKFNTIDKDTSIVYNFTNNFHNLLKNCNVSYRKIGKVIDISIGNLSRFEKGAEPMLSAVIKIAKYFDISIAELLSSNPNFDYSRLSKVVNDKNTLILDKPPITDDMIKKDRDCRIDLLTIQQAQELASFWIDKVNC